MWAIVPSLLLVASLWISPFAAHADSADASVAASPWAATEHGGVRLISATTAVSRDETLALGLQFQMSPGWHIYWRSPGDAGYPPQADWSGSENLASADIDWPAPRRFSAAGVETIGYTDGVVLPVTVRLLHPGEPLRLHTTVDYLTCSDICVPYTADLNLILPANAAAPPSEFAHDLARARALVPGDGQAAGLRIEPVREVKTENGLSLAVEVDAAHPLDTPDVFVEGPSPILFEAPNVRLSDDRRSATFILPAENVEGLSSLAALPVTVTVVDGGGSAEQAMTVLPAGTGTAAPGTTTPGTATPGTATPGAAAAAPAGDRSLAMIIALALLGGLILNLMPCVLPVLSIKLLAVVGHGGGERRAVRAGFIAAALGILFSFMVLAGALLMVRATGTAIGWGLQFQQPWFLTAMILVVTLFACNLWGLYQVPMPRLFGLADEHAGRVRGLGGHFLTGALATVLATPCSAPFLGTAVGFALSRGPAEIVLVFAAIGLGLALPYLLVAAFPALATRMPRPGPWMRRLRQVLGLALAATGGWLCWVLASQVGPWAALAIAVVALAIMLLLALRSKLPRRIRPVGLAAVAALVVAAFFVPLRPAGTASTGAPATTKEREPGIWQPFEPHRVADLVAEGRVVFVNVTADWCITCKVNERLVLESDAVQARLGDTDVVAMRGDWTSPNEAISQYLASFGRYGIPFDAVYGPGMQEGKALPELLSQDMVLQAVDRAAGNMVER